MSDTGSNDPYDPNRPQQPPQPPESPQWGSTPQPPPSGGEWGAGQAAGQPQYGQPQYGQPYGQPPGSPPPNYLVPAILTTVFCCLPLGIASIVFAAQVNGKYASGDLAGAQESSRKAKQFATWSAVVGVVVLVLYIVFAVLLAGTSSV
ncbi:MAG TPA: CD225/dispanin family protein [Actinomycetes bacterium]|nr:CD225/dispanin family protein [Actinomycetes bacterium]